MKKFKEIQFQMFVCKGTAAAVFAVCAMAFTISRTAAAHGFEGERFFPPTIQTEDPFTTDELSLPTISIFNSPAGDDGPKTREIALSAEFSKEIFPKFSLGIGVTYAILKPKGMIATDGFENLSLSAKYQLLEIPEHEFIFSAGAEWEVGNTGSGALGEDPFSTFTPTLYMGKGFGDLPEGVRFLRPLAITATAGLDLPVKNDAPNAIEWGVAIEYSLPYLEQHVKDTGLPLPFRDMIPLVEFTMNHPLNRGGGLATGTVNPGVLWESKEFQVGVEAVVPLNRATGPNVGVVFNVQIFIDDLCPKIFGHPVFGGKRAEASVPVSNK